MPQSPKIFRLVTWNPTSLAHTRNKVGIQQSACLVTMPLDCIDDCLAKAANAALD